MVDADRLDLVLGSRGRSAESAAGNFLGFIEGVFIRNRLRNFNRKEFRLTSGGGGGGNGVSRDLAIQRADRHERMKSRIAGKFGNLIGSELGDRHLVGIDAGFG